MQLNSASFGVKAFNKHSEEKCSIDNYIIPKKKEKSIIEKILLTHVCKALKLLKITGFGGDRLILTGHNITNIFKILLTFFKKSLKIPIIG